MVSFCADNLWSDLPQPGSCGWKKKKKTVPEAAAVSCARTVCLVPVVISGSAGQLNSFPVFHLSDELVKWDVAACHCISMSLVTHVCMVLSDGFMPVTPAACEPLFPGRLAVGVLVCCCCFSLLHFRLYRETRLAAVIYTRYKSLFSWRKDHYLQALKQWWHFSHT